MIQKEKRFCKTCIHSSEHDVRSTHQNSRKKWYEQICIGHVGLFAVAIYILIMQIIY